MTIEQANQRIRQLAFELHRADYGMGMPRNYERVLALRVALNEAIKDHVNASMAAEWRLRHDR